MRGRAGKEENLKNDSQFVKSVKIVGFETRKHNCHEPKRPRDRVNYWLQWLAEGVLIGRTERARWAKRGDMGLFGAAPTRRRLCDLQLFDTLLEVQ